MTLYCGIDLHSNNSIVVVTNESDQVVFQSRFPNDLDLIRQALQPFQAELAGVVVESTYNWYWLVDGLMDAGFSLHLANPAAIKQYQGLKHSDDPSDARWLAHLLRLGILPEGYIYPKAERPLRDLLRKRSQLVRQKVTHILSIENLTLRNTGHALTTDALRRWDNAEVDARFPNPELGLAIKANLAVLRCLEEQIAVLERTVKPQVQAKEGFKWLLTTPGIGPILAMTITLETGDIRRFRQVGQFASYCRCVDSKKMSNGKKKGVGNVKNGNKYLAWAFVEAAHFAIRYEPKIKRFYQRKKTKTKGVIAIKAVAHKMARACYFLMRDQIPFDVHKAFA